MNYHVSVSLEGGISDLNRCLICVIHVMSSRVKHIHVFWNTVNVATVIFFLS